MAGRDREEVAGPQDDLGAVRHAHPRRSADDDPDVLDLAEVGAGDGPYVLGPPPARRVDRAAELAAGDPVELEPSEGEVAGLDGSGDVLEVHERVLALFTRATTRDRSPRDPAPARRCTRTRRMRAAWGCSGPSRWSRGSSPRGSRAPRRASCTS